MEQYIPKSALIAEIKKTIKNIYASREYVGIPYGEECIVKGLQKAEDIINTLEVKEVDLDKEIKKIQYQYKTIGDYDGYPATIYANDIETIAKHFFELRLKVQKENKL